MKVVVLLFCVGGLALSKAGEPLNQMAFQGMRDLVGSDVIGHRSARDRLTFFICASNMDTILVVVVVSLIAMSGVLSLEFIHHDQAQLEAYLQSVANDYPDITYLYSIGHSINGADLWVLALGRDVQKYVELRPNVKYIGNMHGNEVVSREVLLHLIDYYVTSYGTNATITEFLNTTGVHIMPTMNPDGYTASLPGECDGIVGRVNAANLDLNRNFPDFFIKNLAPIQPETQAVMDWLDQENFVLSANLHGGSFVANYPFDLYKSKDVSTWHGESISPDDDVFRFLALTYSKSHPFMSSPGTNCHGSTTFQDGITNGAAWYPVQGGMQDYNYIGEGVFELTLEIACCKYPNDTELPQFWVENKDALVNFLMNVHLGVKGFVLDENNNPIEGAWLDIGRKSPPFVNEYTVPFNSSANGEYFRLLLPGTYSIRVKADKYLTEVLQITIQSGSVLRQDIKLTRDPATVSSAPPPIVFSLVPICLCCLLLSLF